MNSINNIIVGLDLSHNVQAVLSRTFLVAKRNNSEVVIVCALDDSLFSSFISDDKVQNSKLNALKSIEKELKEIDTQDIKYSTIIGKATPSELIIKTAKDIDASLIIIGANEKKDFTTTILGTVAHKIAQHSHLPILIVKNNPKEAYKNIVAFTDLSETSYKSLSFSQELFKQENIKCVYTYKILDEFTLRYHDQCEYKDEINLEIRAREQSKFDEFVKQYNISNAEIIEDRTGETSALVDFVNKNNNDLVALGSKGVNDTGSFLYGSTTSSLMQSLKSDVLVYIPKK